MYSAYTSPPIFYDQTELSATALKILQDNTLILDSIAERNPFGMRIKNIDVGVGGDLHAIWYGAFQKRTGMTTATLTLFTTPLFSENLVIRFNDVTVHNAAMPSGTNTFTFDITGYTDNEVVRVDIYASLSAAQYGSTYIMIDAYCTPVYTNLSWVSPATFGTLSASNLNTLVNAQKYLADYLTYPARPITMHSRWIGGYWKTGDFTRLTTYRVMRSEGHTRLGISMNALSRHNRSTRIDIWVNNTILDSFTFGAWEYVRQARYIDVSSYAVGTNLRVEITETILLGPETSRNALNTKYDFRSISVGRSTYVTPVIGTEFTMLESLSFSSLQTRLNTLGTALTTIYNKISSHVDELGRVRMFGRRPVADFAQEEFFHKGHLCSRSRQGEVLVISGKNITIGWGLDTSDWSKVDDMDYNYAQTQALTDQEQIQTKVFYLDEFPNLYHGENYYLWGDRIDYAAEYYRY